MVTCSVADSAGHISDIDSGKYSEEEYRYNSFGPNPVKPRRAAPIFIFAQKALINQLPTNEPGQVEALVEPKLFVVREHQTSDEQVLSNCDSSVALNRYRTRHDAILMLLARWLQ